MRRNLSQKYEREIGELSEATEVLWRCAAGVEMVMPGDNVTMEIELIATIAMEKELRFAVREGGRTVGAGVVTEVIE